MFVAATALAKEPRLSLTPNEEKSLNFKMDTTPEQTLVTIVDTNGEVIFTEKIATGKTYSKKFDLKNLPDGSYFLEVEDTLKEKVFAFVIQNSKVIIAEGKENAKPVFRNKNGKVFLNLLNLKNEVVKIKILDSDNRVVFQETIVDEIVIEKVFNFEDAFKDNYTVVVQNKKDTYFEDVSVE